jgi:hypothetical protein
MCRRVKWEKDLFDVIWSAFIVWDLLWKLIALLVVSWTLNIFLIANSLWRLTKSSNEMDSHLAFSDDHCINQPVYKGPFLVLWEGSHVHFNPPKVSFFPTKQISVYLLVFLMYPLKDRDRLLSSRSSYDNDKWKMSIYDQDKKRNENKAETWRQGDTHFLTERIRWS